MLKPAREDVFLDFYVPYKQVCGNSSSKMIYTVFIEYLL